MNAKARPRFAAAGAAGLLAAGLLSSCGGSSHSGGSTNRTSTTSAARPPVQATPGRQPLASPKGGVLHLGSAAFGNGARLPRRFACNGEGKSPPLSWSGVPADTRSLILMVEDPDAPGGTFLHWSVYAIGPKKHRFPAGGVPGGAMQGRNSLGKAAYQPPCPPPGAAPHHYVFRLYAVPHRAPFGPGAELTAVRRLAQTATARGKLVARYSR